MSGSPPRVTVAVPVLNEAQHIDACLASIAAQTYPEIVEVLVIDGGSDDETRTLAGAYPKVRLLANPYRIQAAALNLAVEHGGGEILVRVDGHCRLSPTYVENCVRALRTTGAAMVGGAMHAVGHNWVDKGIAAALNSRLGAGTARFHTGGPSSWVDTVYLGAFHRELAKEVGGYANVATNEDAEFAIRMRPHGGIWFDRDIVSSYTPRPSYGKLARQFFHYGRGRAATLRRHPASLSLRQLAAPALLLSLLTPWRCRVLLSYAVLVVARSGLESRARPSSAPGLLFAIPSMHLPWGVGFLIGLFTEAPHPPRLAVPFALTQS